MLTDTIFSKLHDEIKTEIFSRVPAKSVGKFKYLSKTWNTILSTPYFVNLHLSRNSYQESLILVREKPGISIFFPNNSLHIVKLPIENHAISKELEFGNTWSEVVGSCNGLVLLSNWEKDMCLVNPTTLEQIKVPDLPYASKKVCCFLGFGYDSSRDDYKIVVISRLYSADNRRINALVDVYSVKSGVWGINVHSICWFTPIGSSCGAFVNGSVHWFVNRHKSGDALGILAFDMSTEVFYDVGIPLAFSRMSCRLFAHEGRLCTLNSYPFWNIGRGPSGKIDVWMMNEYGMVNSWTKLGSVDGNKKRFMHRPLYFSRDEDILLVKTKETMIVYNLQEGTEREMVVDVVPASILDGCSFVDSLVSLKGITSSS